MLFLWIFGDNVEDYLGHFTYLVLLPGQRSGRGRHAHSAEPTPACPSVGASGAIAGVMGAYFILYPRARVLVWFPPIFFFHVPAWLMLGYWFVINFLSGTALQLPRHQPELGRNCLLGARGRVCGGHDHD
jgi:membrane associated rhomboid family serine protease